MQEAPPSSPLHDAEQEPAQEHATRETTRSAAVRLTAGAAVAALGLAVLCGWWVSSTRIVQVFESLAPMQFNTALCFVLCGAGMLCARRARLASQAAGGLAALIGALTLAEYAFGIDLRIDQALHVHTIAVTAPHPGRMAPNTAACFLATGLAVAMLGSLASSNRRTPRRWIFLLASIVLMLSVIALIGYLVGVDSTYRWWKTTRMALHTSAGFVVMSAAMLATTMLGRRYDAMRDRALPIPVTMASLGVTLAVWQAILAEERNQLHRAVQRQAQRLAGDITRIAEHRIDELDRMAERWKHRGGTPRADFEADSTVYLAHRRGLESIGWIDENLQLRWLWARKDAARTPALKSWIPDALRRANVHDAVTIGRLGAPLDRNGRVLIALPLAYQERFDGFIVGSVRVDELVNPVAQAAHQQGYQLSILDGATPLYTDSRADAALDLFTAEHELSVHLANWRVRVWPGPAAVAGFDSALPEAGLTAGLIISALFGMTVHLARRAVIRSDELERHVRSRTADLHRANESLARSAGRLRLALDAEGAGIWSWSIQDNAAHGDAQLSRLHGVAPSDDPKPFEEWMSLVHPDDAPRVEEELRRALERSEYAFDAEYRVRWPNGAVRELRSQAIVARDDKGEATQVTGVCVDITERKFAERMLEEFNAELRTKNEDLEQFAYLASHDLQEPLRKIQSFADILRTTHAAHLNKDANHCLERMHGAATRMRQLIDDLLSYGRVSSRGATFTRVDLSDVAAGVLSDLEVAIRESGAEVDMGELPEIEADQVQMRQLLQNLIGNALKFHAKGTPPRVHVHAVIEQRSASPHCILTVQDEGVGFDAEFAHRAFEPFRRLHSREQFEGAGIGLAVCRKIARRHAGEILAQSAPGQGATFTVTLPVTQAPKDFRHAA